MTKEEYNIYAGLGGGFGGAKYHSTILAGGIEEATSYAYECARNEYEMYEGMHGIQDWQDICEGLGYDPLLITEQEEKDVDTAYIEEVENWIEYYVVLTSEDTETSEEELIREHDIC